MLVITSSVQTYFHFPITPVYGATKHAMHVFVGALALELAPHNITVNHIGPGWVQTQMNDTSPELQTEQDILSQRDAIPHRRAGTTDERRRARSLVGTATRTAQWKEGASRSVGWEAREEASTMVWNPVDLPNSGLSPVECLCSQHDCLPMLGATQSYQMPQSLSP